MKKENENEKLKNEYEEKIVKYIIEQNEELSIEEIEEELNCGISLIKRVIKRNDINKKKTQRNYSRKTEFISNKVKTNFDRKMEEMYQQLIKMSQGKEIIEIELKTCAEMQLVNKLEVSRKVKLIKIVNNKRIIKIENRGDKKNE
jgi:hypothetical protein